MIAFTYFKEQGIQKIGVTLGRSRKLSSNSKITVRLAHDYFPNFSEDLIFWDCLTEEDGKEAAAYFADKGVEAIFTNGDHVAAGQHTKGLTDGARNTRRHFDLQTLDLIQLAKEFYGNHRQNHTDKQSASIQGFYWQPSRHSCLRCRREWHGYSRKLLLLRRGTLWKDPL